MKPKSTFWKKTLLIPFASLLLAGCSNDIRVLNPKGPVARTQFELISYSFWLMLGVLVVVFGLFAFMIIKYRERPDNLDYEPPEQEGNTVLELVWTAIPVLIIIALAIPTVKSLYQLEEVPKGFEDVKPITIKVTSADWKWIFSYPDEGIETVNYVNIPEDTPIKFQLTSVGNMNSFWVPELGGQKYTMAGMEMPLILQADNPGEYLGRSANFSGKGFTDMDFEVVSQAKKDYDKWKKDVHKKAPKLTKDMYEQILTPGNMGRMTFSSTHLSFTHDSNRHTSTQHVDSMKEENMNHHHHGSQEEMK